MSLSHVLALPLNWQLVFDTSVAAILKQGNPSAILHRSDEDGTEVRCLYRDGNTGNMCLIGHLIPDDQYDDRFENEPAATALNKMMGLTLDTSDADFLNDLKRHTHDCAATNDLDDTVLTGSDFVYMFRKTSANFAARMGLDASVLDA